MRDSGKNEKTVSEQIIGPRGTLPQQLYNSDNASRVSFCIVFCEFEYGLSPS